MNNTAQNNTREAITFTKLRDGSWGLRGPADLLAEGETVTVYKRNGEAVERTVDRVVWSDGDTAIASVEGARKPPKRGGGQSQPATPPQAASEPEKWADKAPASHIQMAELMDATEALCQARKRLAEALADIEAAEATIKRCSQREVDERHTVRLGPDVDSDLADERAATADRSERRGVTVVMTERTATPPPAVVDTEGETVSTDAEPDGFDVGDLF